MGKQLAIESEGIICEPDEGNSIRITVGGFWGDTFHLSVEALVEIAVWAKTAHEEAGMCKTGEEMDK